LKSRIDKWNNDPHNTKYKYALTKEELDGF
jgi:hypothetical protein